METDKQTDNSKQAAHTGVMVAADKQHHRFKQKTKNKLVWLGAATVLVVAVLVFWFYGPPSATQRATTSAEHQLASKGITYSKLAPTQKSQYLVDKGAYKAAEQVWQNQLLQTTDSKAKVTILCQQSAVALQFKDYAAAQKYADAAKKILPNADSPYVALAQLAQAKGDKAAAKQYWQQAIANIDPDADGANLMKSDRQQALDDLK